MMVMELTCRYSFPHINKLAVKLHAGEGRSGREEELERRKEGRGKEKVVGKQNEKGDRRERKHLTDKTQLGEKQAKNRKGSADGGGK
jgi:predicted phage gp36 major capsid-like protein